MPVIGAEFDMIKANKKGAADDCALIHNFALGLVAGRAGDVDRHAWAHG